jgi:hypothetical protein
MGNNEVLLPDSTYDEISYATVGYIMTHDNSGAESRLACKSPL